MSPSEASPFHAGERALQAGVGIRERAEQVGRRMIRSALPEQHRAFFAELPTLILGTLDGLDRPWASVVVGPPGFVSSPDPSTLVVAARPFAEDPARLVVGAPVAVLGLQHDTRRRNRANGVVTASVPSGFAMRVQQSFGNCPQHIHPRTPQPLTPTRLPQAVSGRRATAEIVEQLQGADTFFIASAGAGLAARDGLDVSHRGGPPGFVRVTEDGSVVEWPEYAGNGMFNTLGNLAMNPRAGLLFLDFEGDTALSITGRAELVWGDALVTSVRLTIEETLRVEHATSLRWTEA